MATKKTTESAAKKAAKPPAKTAAKKATAPRSAKPAETGRGKSAGKSKQPVTHEQISQLAYQYWLERGRPDGFHHEDWLKAEKALKG